MRSSALLAAGLAIADSATPVSVSRPLSHALHPLPAPLTRRQANETNPCAEISEIYMNSWDLKAPARLAFECIMSVPLNVTSAQQLLDSLPPFIQWQSTLDSLKNPPEEYATRVQPPVDIMGGLKQIESGLYSGKYSTEYEFGWDLYTLIQSAHDGHFNYVLDAVGYIFTWGRPVPLVSVSEDGSKLPAIFAYQDVLGAHFKNISYTPSPVVQIDGMDATEWAERWSLFGQLQDRDALYNYMFYSLPQVSLGGSGAGTGFFTGGGRGRFVYPGETTTLTFANGTTYTMENYARFMVPFRNITSTQDLIRRYIYYGNEAVVQTRMKSDREDTASPAMGATAPGYPNPVVPGPDNIINGFFLEEPGYEDVAVLQVPTFVGSSAYGELFQETTRKFLALAKQAGKTKLIIDVQANGGGIILEGYDLFKQLFPDIQPDALNRFRAIEAVDFIGQAFSQYGSKYPHVATSNFTLAYFLTSYFNYQFDMTADSKSFESWEQKFGPVQGHEGMYTTPHQWNLSDVNIQYQSGGINITGYGPLANVSRERPFEPENIVLLTDGYCASTCTIFAELLTKQAGVKTIALGGRANTDPMQALGGTKGTNNYAFTYIQGLAEDAIGLADGELKKRLNNSILRTNYVENRVHNYRAAVNSAVNTRDGIQYEDDSGIALQFIYEEADCRLYYTPEMTIDASAVWRAVYDAQWTDGSKCITGGSGYGRKRATTPKTKELKARRLQVGTQAAQRAYEALEKTFELETDCKWEADGFMQP
ncbi:peptidase S41 family protein [Sporormia fimetaria CBS 119925]|uniref:Peptidase S41 family protein n=1 Tax=Sporormia fimetaria CBS 119925 TaxID=1340428 RepID=A0A6A6V9M2_9PLEO|nr:peptidase S41 family protein [Sporormia fimetaria CBS 119925]